MKRSLLSFVVSAAVVLGAMLVAPPVKAQEIQLTGPLAGAPSVRKKRLYRDGRVELTVGPGFTLLDEYERSIFIAGKLQYNIFDFLSVGIFGGFAAANLDTDLTEKVDSTPAPRNTRTATNLPSKVGAPAFDSYTGKLKFMAVPQVTFSPFRGKLAIFQKVFVDTDLYISLGPAFVGVNERADCTACTTAASFGTTSRTAVTGSGALGLSFYISNFISANLEYRAMPFKWNRGGFDSRGGGPDGQFPDNKISAEDHTFKFNQMIFLGVGFYLPTAPKVSD